MSTWMEDYNELESQGLLVEDSFVDAETLQELFGYDLGTPEYNLKLLPIRNKIEDEKDLFTKQYKGGLLIYGLDEISDVSARKTKNDIKKRKKIVKILRNTDLNELRDQFSRQKHIHQQELQEILLQNSIKEQRNIKRILDNVLNNLEEEIEE